MEEKQLFSKLVDEIIGEKIEGFVVIFGDNREKSQIPKILMGIKDVIYIETTLLAGDYLVSDRIGFELKKEEDFANSTLTKNPTHNLKKQMRNLESIVRYPNLIVQNLKKLKFTHPHLKKQLEGILESFKYKYPVWETKTDQQTAKLIYERAKKEQLSKHTEDIPRSQYKKASLEEKQEFLVEGLEGVGSDTVKKLMTIGNPIEIFNEIINTEIIYTRKGKPKDIAEGKIKSLGGLSHKFIEKNKKLLSS